MQHALREASRPAKIKQQCTYAAWGPLGSGSLSTLGLVTGTISGSHMCIVYNIFNFKSLAAIFILRWYTATGIMEVCSAAEWPTMDLVLQALLVQARPSSRRRSDPGRQWSLTKDFLFDGAKSLASLHVPVATALYYCNLTSQKRWFTKHRL